MKRYFNKISDLFSVNSKIDKLTEQVNILSWELDKRNFEVNEMRKLFSSKSSLSSHLKAIDRHNTVDLNLLDAPISTKPGINNAIEYDLDINKFLDEVKKYILKTDVWIDIGCGVRPITFYSPQVHICIEPYKEYRDIIKPFFPNRTNFIFIQSDAVKALKVLDDNSVDTVIMMDLIEHLRKQDGQKLIQEADRVARKQIIVFTPYGFSPQSYTHNEKDAWGLNGANFQKHRSGWLPEDFGEEWSFYICHNSHEAFLEKEKLKGKKYNSFFAIKTKTFRGYPIHPKTPKFVRDTYNTALSNKK